MACWGRGAEHEGASVVVRGAMAPLYSGVACLVGSTATAILLAGGSRANFSMERLWFRLASKMEGRVCREI